MVNQVFRLHGIPVDIVSDRGPQFISQFWRAFGRALGATISPSSGFHPQSNGQTERLNQELEASLRCVAVSNCGRGGVLRLGCRVGGAGVWFRERCDCHQLV